MRLGVVVDLDQVQVSALPALADRVEQAGLEMVWLRSSTGTLSPLAAAASCAAVAEGLLVGAEVPVDDTHPIYAAEERNVVDQLLGGRLVLGLRTAGRADLDEEWLQVLLAAGGGRPFRHDGTHFTIPAGLAHNVVNPERQVRVTPAPFSLEPQMWILGATDLAGRYGLSLVVDADWSSRQAHEEWARYGPPGFAVDRLRRPRMCAWDPAITDAADLAVGLVAERDTWGLDTVVTDIAAAAGSHAWADALADLAGVVRPRVQAHVLPPGLEHFWDNERMQRRMNEREVTT